LQHCTGKRTEEHDSVHSVLFWFRALEELFKGWEGLHVTTVFVAVHLASPLFFIQASFVSLSEYSKSSDVARSRARFFQGERALMLVTERFWFFRRPQLRGGIHAIFYSLPDCSLFYKEVVDALPRGGGSVLILVTKYDKFQLEGVLGKQRAIAVLSSGRDAHEFHWTSNYLTAHNFCNKNLACEELPEQNPSFLFLLCTLHAG